MPTRTPLEGERAKRIGRIVEKDFSSWCTKNNLTINKAEEDDEGWDFFVQSKVPLASTSFLDRKPPSFSGLVQVKGTESADGRFRMSLANALKLTKYLGPAFVFAATVEGDDIAKAWLVHCGKTFMKRVLKAAARSSPTGKPFNKRFLRFTPTEGDLIVRPRLRQAFEAPIAGKPYRYLRRKNKFVRTVGYGKVGWEFAVRFRQKPTDADFEEMADFAVGLRKELRLEQVDVYDMRFGERRHVERHEDTTMELPNFATSTKAHVILTGPDGEMVDLLCAPRVASAVFPFLPKKFNRARLSAPYLDFIVTAHPARAATNLLRWTTRDFGGVISDENLDDMARAATVLRLLQTPGARARMVAGGIERTLPVGGEFQSSDDNAMRFARALESFRTVARAFDLPLRNETFDIPALLRFANELGLLAAVATHADTEAEVVFPEGAVSTKLRAGQQCASLHPVLLPFREFTLVVVTAVVGRLRRTKKEWRLSTTRLPRLAHRVVDVRPGVPRVEAKTLKALFKEAGDALRSQGVKTVLQAAQPGRKRTGRVGSTSTSWSMDGSPPTLKGHRYRGAASAG